MCAFARIACGSTVLENSAPVSCSSASHDEPQNSLASSPVIRFVPPTHSATGPSLGLSPPMGS